MSGGVRSLGGLAGRLVIRWRVQLAALAAACGVVAATIAGGLGVGDTLRAGLLRLAVGRLGRIDAAVCGETPFRRDLAIELATDLAGDSPPVACTPALVLPVTLAAAERPAGGTRATLLACDDPAGLGFAPPPPALEEGGVFVNARLAAAAGVASGDAVILRIPKRSAVPADSPLGRRDAASVGRRLRVAAVLPDAGPQAGLGRFSLRPAAAPEPLAVIALSDAQEILREGDVANTVFFATAAPGGRVDAGAVARRIRPTLADLAAAIEPVAVPEDAPEDAPEGGAVLRLSSRRLLIPPALDQAAAAVLGPRGGRATLAFLANEIAVHESGTDAARARVPYSTVLGIDATTLPGGRLLDAAGTTLDVPLDDEIVINRWLADDLAAQGRPVAAGDLLSITCFMPETIHGRVEERVQRFRVAGIAEMTAAAVDRSLVPEVEGVTDEESIADWDPPFPFEASRVRNVPPHDEDDRYWKQHRATPKAFVSLAAARRLAGGRFGDTTAWHVAGTAAECDAVAAEIATAVDPQAAGLRVVDLRAEAEAAARGSTPFGGLFVALSSFVVAAGLILVWLLFGLLVAAHARTLGTLAAVGFAPRRLAALLVLAGVVAAMAGGCIGAVVGPAWTRLLVSFLGRAWDRDVAAGSAEVFAGRIAPLGAVLTGAAVTIVLALGALAVAARRVGRLPPLTILRGGAAAQGGRAARRVSLVVAALAAVAALGLAAAGRRAGAAAAPGLFFASGFTALAALLAVVRIWLSSRPGGPLRSLAGFAGRMVAARPARAFSVAAMVACGQFLVVAVSAFLVRPPADPGDRSSPTGGWTLIASFGEPTSIDPTDAATRETLGLTSDQAQAMTGCTIARLRSSDGDDASCTNLYATASPVVVGVGPDFIRRGGFRFVGHEPLFEHAGGSDVVPDAAPGLAENPWQLLERLDRDGDHAIPAILDQATAQWALKLGGVGSRFALPDGTGAAVDLRIVGLLEPGILQGRVLVAERAFERLFPSRSGYSLALLDDATLDPRLRTALPAAVRAAWADAAVSLEPAMSRLRSLQAVQNTFLAGFQALGTLGLLLGTAGVAAVQLQGVAERLRGLAALRALGFTMGRVRALLAAETLATVAAGVVAGTLAGLIATWPAVAEGAARLPLAWIAFSAVATLLVATAAGWLAGSGAVIPERPSAE
ncbi:MAG: FtsX-like permease family protein [Planctomycetaceae bacterium]